MARRWVVNASPLITLSKIGQVDLLPRLCDRFVIPAGVARELAAGAANDPAKTWMRKSGRRYIHEVRLIPPPLLAWDLGVGESEVLAYAHGHSNWEAILDDRAARRCAETFRIPVRGTIGIILLAKQAGLIPAVRPVFDQLEKAGLFVSTEIVVAALRIVGEAR